MVNSYPWSETVSYKYVGKNKSRFFVSREVEQDDGVFPIATVIAALTTTVATVAFRLGKRKKRKRKWRWKYRRKKKYIMTVTANIKIGQIN